MIKVIFQCPVCEHDKGKVITWDRETVVECEICDMWETMGEETVSE